MLLAHAHAVKRYREMYQGLQGGKIGITNCADWREPASHDPADIAAAARGVIMKLGWFASPVFGGQGDYDDTVSNFVQIVLNLDR